MHEARHDWTVAEARAIHSLPIPELLFRAQSVHRAHHPPDAVQLCTLLSVKTGGCPEDCGYCPQSARYQTGVEKESLMAVDEVLKKAKLARSRGATRFCMGAAWRSVKPGRDFEAVLDMVRGVRELGMEACVTAGMLSDKQAAALKDAGLSAYNHNLDSSKEFYGEVIQTRQYQDRLKTIQRVADAGINVCSGGIIGMGESDGDRLGMLVTLSRLTPHPESVPINALVAVPGTPLEDQPPVKPLELVRMCATARIMMPQAMVRLSAGRTRMSSEAQMLCFMGGANSIFYGEKLLTTGNPETEQDLEMLHEAGMRALTPALEQEAEAGSVELPSQTASAAP